MQAITQGFFPRFRIVHTSASHSGQIYIPVISYTLMALTLIITVAFRTSARLSNAYGASSLKSFLDTPTIVSQVLVSSSLSSRFDFCMMSHHLRVAGNNAEASSLSGLAVICDMFLTTCFMTLIILAVWRKHTALAAAFFLVFATIEAAFLSSSLLKVRRLTHLYEVFASLVLILSHICIVACHASDLGHPVNRVAH